MHTEYPSSEHDLRITRTFDAPIEKVWAAWTEQDQAKQWWSPKNLTTPYCSIDLRVGGKTLNCMRDPSGKEVWSTGTFLEIVPMEKLVFTDSFSDKDGNVVSSTVYGMPEIPLELLVTVTFKAEGGTTVVTLLHQGMAVDQHYAGANQGWNEMFDKLETILQ